MEELLEFLEHHYFADWELERASRMPRRKAIQFLEGEARRSCRGYAGPGDPRYITISGKVYVTRPEKPFGDDPDLVVTCHALAVRMVNIIKGGKQGKLL